MNIETDIFTYDEWEIDSYMATIEPGGRLFYNDGKKDLLPDTVEVIGSDVCKYCQTKLLKMSIKVPIDIHYMSHKIISVGLCPLCGFWFDHRLHSDKAFGGSEVSYIPKLRIFPIDDIEVPIDTLNRHLAKRPDLVHLINHYKFEEFVANMLTDLFDCSVEMTKQSRDGGYDLICIDSNSGKRLVQVKHYNTEHKVDVSVIRELAGVIIREEEFRGLVVTSSDFTRDAINEANTLSRSKRRYRIEMDLYSSKEIFHYLEVLAFRSEFDVLERAHIGDTLREIHKTEQRMQRIARDWGRTDGTVFGNYNAEVMKYLQDKARC